MRSTFRRGMWTTELRMNVGPETVWSVITDVQTWPRWGPTVSDARVDGDSGLTVGARGTVTTVAGLSLPFEITDFVERRSWAWKVAGVRATRHEVIEVPGGCVLSFGAPVWAAGYLPVLAIALPRIERISVERARLEESAREGAWIEKQDGRM
ncbi:SRPBCC family protein [Dietzia sp. B32]|uniref:SRPBCC family protein n=1 Tax=Dietzia sp. B32 TaxID=2915130 RepID=UPI0021AE0BFC|nr:SRPBCC family protein [Dietzia sp. B32]UVE95390.1 SRPBCC family protein [Dietzia sp. B32]